jgi:hypothetical protein
MAIIPINRVISLCCENKIHNNMGKWGTVNPELRGHLGDKEKVVF